jgi:hypothetical protein
MHTKSITTGRLADFRFEILQGRPCTITVQQNPTPSRKKPPYRYQLINATDLQIGDRVVIIAKDGLTLQVSGAAGTVPVLPVPADSRLKTQDCLYIAYLHRPGKLKIRIKGKPRAKIIIPVTMPAMPAVAPASRRQPESVGAAIYAARGRAPLKRTSSAPLLRDTGDFGSVCASRGSRPEGLGVSTEATAAATRNGGAGSALCGPLQPQLAFPDSEVLHPYDRFIFAVDLVAESGCNFLSLSPLSYWNNSGSIAYQYLPPAPFVKGNGKYDLRRIDPTYRKVLTCMFRRAARAGITVDWYLLDHVSFTHDWMWNKHPLNAANNVHGWITADGCSCGYNKTWALNVTHKYESVPKGCGSAEMRSVFTTMLRNLAGLVPKDLRPRVRVGPGIETESRTFDWWVVTQIIKPLGLRAISNLKAWYDNKAFADGWMPGILETDQKWWELAQNIVAVVLHGCDSGGETARRLARLFEAAQRYHFNLMASTDGAGLGSPKRRPEGNRPSVDDLEKAWQEGLQSAKELFSGLEVKHLGLADARLVFPALARRITLIPNADMKNQTKRQHSVWQRFLLAAEQALNTETKDPQ